ncbi:MAG: dethiobiotin synthase [Magnetospirillum sp. WYHS-4]
MKGLFVTGTGTGVGKTVASACLAKALGADYWKPIQTGWPQDDDAAWVAAMAGAVVHPNVCRFRAPRSPHEAAAREGGMIDLGAIRRPVTDRPLVVEGAGGVLVPLNEAHCMADLMVHLGLPVVLVAATGLGTINHSLLSLEALRARGLLVAGAILTGPPDSANRQAIQDFGRVRILGELPPADPLDTTAIAGLARQFEGLAW